MKKTNPWAFVPTLYFAEGLPYIIANAVSILLYADLGFKNDFITFWTSWLYLPWSLKMFWSPVVDSHGTKRQWLLSAQTILSVTFLVLAFILAFHSFFLLQKTGEFTFLTLSLFSFFFCAVIGATMDIATDGYYMLALSAGEQASFVGIRTISFRAAMILGNGLLVSAAGYLAEKGLPKPYNWVLYFMVLGFVFFFFSAFHAHILPKPAADKPVKTIQHTAQEEAFRTYFSQKSIVYILLFILLYRLGEAFLSKVVPLFLVGPAEQGALGISVKACGFITGTLGLGAIIAGNLAGGWLLGKFGFKKCIWPFAVALVLPNFFYVYLATVKPGIITAATLITLENFGYGLAMMALTLFILYVSQGKYKTSHYAISTGIMALGMMVPGMVSGKMQMVLGYERFFWVTSLISLITFAIVPLAFKINVLDEMEQKFHGQK